MTTATAIKTKTQAQVREAAAVLQPLLTDLIHLQIQAKQAHWNIRGPFFTPIHAFLDQMAGSYVEFGDQVAERILALGEPAEGRLSRVAADTRLAEISGGFIQDEDVLKFFDGQLGEVIARSRAAQQALGELDSVSEDLVLDLLATLEKQAWMIRSQLGR